MGLTVGICRDTEKREPIIVGGKSSSNSREHMFSAQRPHFVFMMVFSCPSFSGDSDPSSLPSVAGWAR